MQNEVIYVLNIGHRGDRVTKLKKHLFLIDFFKI